ncbi:DUF262 domain-containing protein [Brasilonema octagenarum UFV-E1]|uniref:DUF262 domain-containing protein n=2 Tax=Brasilonema TaxID=383614 RepID=A0A856MND2_9CYAN|nr:MULTISPECIES: DUF262 domain-containing protein [Brasilonema]NMF65506.1 DUF262 domain-containing protein [Brasilonema octagenarum UFV-OR1]QDL11590.1 DUF262 domain-containing protein [Brasilonema sennae CENA114]QDL17968.1 DUF262 domain-containing protein [Brasilonema octagenarum UFV-E1]
MRSKPEITQQRQEAAEVELREKQKPVDYDTKEYPIEILVQKYMDGIDEDVNELFIPDYQREMAWDEDRQSKFIESVLLGLPIPYIFVADVRGDEQDEARLEIIDGSQRIRTLARFLNNQLTLDKLEKLKKLNGFTFEDLPLARQRRFKRSTLRMIQLSEEADEEVRRDLFERINTGSVELNKMEKRRGILRGPFLDLIEELSKNSKFRHLCLFSNKAINSREPQEYILRFFAFLNNYQKYGSEVNSFLNEFLERYNKDKELNTDDMRTEFELMIHFVEKYFPNGFRQGKKLDKTTTRIKFESLAAGSTLALREKKDLIPKSTEWINSEEYKKYTSSDASSSKNKVIRRIEYVREQLLVKS